MDENPWDCYVGKLPARLTHVRRDWDGGWRRKAGYAVFHLYMLVGGLGFLLDISVLIFVAAIPMAVWAIARHVYIEKVS